ncbi:alpha-phosphoglucomutase [Acetitomaculum ruminis DSM 5522]|uniref:Phosphoglucomutase n=1 Tax=Acetitomaculum ruminis DSM 5522 TaxID=1120918 RepID=A0A1I0W1P1_9FIRM|nr:phospho-sugar mutase [Acetitomaculum ruminis]SFA82665.1 alpha-phosphoglucomutase [Acetitomaculum ruminis DSM 5522]
MGYKEVYESWLKDDYFDEKTRKELESIANDENEIKERFYTNLSFGTAGLRGIIGAGTNRMNVYTVRKATQGLANYIKKVGKEERGVAIAFDSRIMSIEFSMESALCLCANGIKAYLFESLRPTPMLSFAVRHLNCIAGINITASHNPSEYNGYKVYWEDGAQITPPHDTGIMEEVLKVEDFSTVKTMSQDEAKAKGLLTIIGKDVDDAYDNEIRKLVLEQDAITKNQKDIKIVYTPLHGTGNIPVRRVLKELGFENVYVVKEQELPDGKFPTVGYPNPETPKAFELGEKLGKEIDADLILATDPDADRLGVHVKDSKTGEYHALTGNMSGCLICEYELNRRQEKYGLPKDGAVIKSIVSSNLSRAIADYYKVDFFEVLTGFKYIGQKILEFEHNNKGTYLFGFEESYGCLIGDYARDKDAVSASMALCEAAAYYKGQGKTLWDVMLDIYNKYGYYLEDVKSITLSGIEGLEKIKKIMEHLRNNPPKEIAGKEVIAVRDYQLQTIVNTKTGQKTETGLPTSNVLYYDLPDNGWVCVRPSGTEPKIKVYVGVNEKDMDTAKVVLDKVIECALKLTEI